MKCKSLILTASMGFAAFLVGPAQALAQSGSSPGSADFAVLAGTAVTCTRSDVIGDVGVWPGTAVTQTNCTISGTVHPGDNVAKQAYKAFLAEYDRLAAEPCDYVIDGNLAGQVLTPGVYCVDAASTTTDGVLTLDGTSNDTWIFKIGTSGTGALTGTNLSVVFTGEGEPCNVTWWVAQGATLTDSDTESSHPFVGTILAGAAITITGDINDPITFTGDAFAKAAVTMTDTNLVGCEGGTGPGNGRHHCNQGVGNGPEGCDPGNSNQGDPSRSNDELGGTPGNPGRKGGNGK